MYWFADDFFIGRKYLNTASKQTDIESAHESERGKGKRSRRPPERYSPDQVDSSEDESNRALTSHTQLLSGLPKPPLTVGNWIFELDWKHYRSISIVYCVLFRRTTTEI
jgi:hypothetical protein